MKPREQQKERITIILVGNPKSGKTKLLEQYKKGIYSEAYNETIAASFATKTLADAILEIWDTAGEERFKSLIPMYIKAYKRNCIMVTCDLSDAKCLEDMTNWVSWLKELKNTSPIIFIGTKADFIGRPISDDQFISKATELGCHHVITSAKNNQSVSEAFLSAKFLGFKSAPVAKTENDAPVAKTENDAPVAKTENDAPAVKVENVAPAKSPKFNFPTFLKEHWREMLIGGLVVGGIVAIGVFTGGIAIAAAGAAVAGAVAAGVIGGAVIGKYRDYKQDYKQRQDHKWFDLSYDEFHQKIEEGRKVKKGQKQKYVNPALKEFAKSGSRDKKDSEFQEAKPSDDKNPEPKTATDKDKKPDDKKPDDKKPTPPRNSPR